MARGGERVHKREQYEQQHKSKKGKAHFRGNNHGIFWLENGEEMR